MENTTTFNTPGRTSTADATPVRATTGADRLRTKAAVPVSKQKIVIECQHREGWKLIVRPVVTQDQLDIWQKQSKRGTTDPDPVKFASLVLANTVTDIIIDDEAVGLNFRSEDALNVFDAASAAGAVRAFYTVTDEDTGEPVECDADLLVDHAAVLAAAGWSERNEHVRPLPPSSPPNRK